MSNAENQPPRDPREPLDEGVDIYSSLTDPMFDSQDFLKELNLAFPENHPFVGLNIKDVFFYSEWQVKNGEKLPEITKVRLELLVVRLRMKISRLTPEDSEQQSQLEFLIAGIQNILLKNLALLEEQENPQAQDELKQPESKGLSRRSEQWRRGENLPPIVSHALELMAEVEADFENDTTKYSNVLTINGVKQRLAKAIEELQKLLNRESVTLDDFDEKETNSDEINNRIAFLSDVETRLSQSFEQVLDFWKKSVDDGTLFPKLKEAVALSQSFQALPDGDTLTAPKIRDVFINALNAISQKRTALEVASQEYINEGRQLPNEVTRVTTDEAVKSNDFYKPTRQVLIPEQYSYVDNKLDEVNDLIQKNEHEIYEFWTKNIDKIHPSLKQLLDVASDTSASLDDLTELLTSTKKILANFDFASVGSQFEEYLQKNYWDVVEKVILDRTNTIVEATGGLEDLEKLRDLLHEKCLELSEKEPIIVTHQNANIIVNVLKQVTDYKEEILKAASGRGPEAEALLIAVEREVYTLEFRLYKAAILRTFENSEGNNDGTSTIDPLMTNVITPLLSNLKEVGGKAKFRNSELAGAMEAEATRFETYIVKLATLYFAEKVVRDHALGVTTSADQTSPMNMPGGLPVYAMGADNGVLKYFLEGEAGEMGSCKEAELRIAEEVKESVNPVLYTRKIKYFDYTKDCNDPTITGEQRFVEKEVGINAWGQALRHLDDFFSGRAPEKLKKSRKEHYLARRRTFYAMTGREIVALVREFEEAELKVKFQEDLAEAKRLGVSEPNRNSDIYKCKITDKQAIRAWNTSIYLMRPFFQAPSSFDKAAPVYYAFNLDYIWQEKRAGTTDFSALMLGAIFGYCAPTLEELGLDGLSDEEFDKAVKAKLKEKNPEKSDREIDELFKKLDITKESFGSTKLFESYSLKTEGETAAELAASFVAPKNIRKTMLRVFEEKDEELHHAHEAAKKKGQHAPEPFMHKYRFLADLPLFPLRASGSFINSSGEPEVFFSPFVHPLTNMTLKDENGAPVRFFDPETGMPSDENTFMTFDDLRDLSQTSSYRPDGRLMYELLPLSAPGDKTAETVGASSDEDELVVAEEGVDLGSFSGQIVEEQITWWINQAKNIEAFYKNILTADEKTLAEHGAKNVAQMMKDSKYAINLMLPYAPYIRNYALEQKKRGKTEIKKIKTETLIRRIILSVALIQGILLVAQGKTTEEVKVRLNSYNLGDKEGVEAVMVALEAGFGSTALAKEFLDHLAKQIEKRLSFT